MQRYRVIDTTLESSEPPPQKLPTPPPPDEAPFAVFEARIQRISFPREEDRMLEAKLESHDPTVRTVPRPLECGAAMLLAQCYRDREQNHVFENLNNKNGISPALACPLQSQVNQTEKVACARSQPFG